MGATPKPSRHSEVLPSRYTPEQARKVRAASVLAGGSVSGFIRTATLAAAQDQLADASDHVASERGLSGK